MRITLLATLVFAVAFTVGSMLLVNAVHDSLEDGVRADNRLFLSTVADQVAAGAPVTDVLVPNIAAGYQIIDRRGAVVGGSAGLVGEGPLAVVGGQFAGSALPVATAADRAQILGIRQVDTPGGAKFTVAVASPLDGVRRSVDAVVRYLKFGIPLLILLVGGLVWLVVRRALRPVEAIREEVEAISHGTLHRRVPVSSAGDEVAKLAGTMNDMLDRLEGSAERQRAFVSDVSHELRSPLAASRTMLEVTGSGDADVDWDALRADLLDENRRMAGLVDGLLELARARQRVARSARVWSRSPTWWPTKHRGAARSRSTSARCPMRWSTVTPTSWLGHCGTCSTTPSGTRRREWKSRWKRWRTRCTSSWTTTARGFRRPIVSACSSGSPGSKRAGAARTADQGSASPSSPPSPRATVAPCARDSGPLGGARLTIALPRATSEPGKRLRNGTPALQIATN